MEADKAISSVLFDLPMVDIFERLEVAARRLKDDIRKGSPGHQDAGALHQALVWLLAEAKAEQARIDAEAETALQVWGRRAA